MVAQFERETSTTGEFVRQPNRFTDRVTAGSASPPGGGPDAQGRWPVEAGRYRLGPDPTGWTMPHGRGPRG
jgi:putative glutathione S-transferase